MLDNPYSVAKARSDKAGRVLAKALMQKVQGERPVVLIGYSLGARVIYQALLALAEQNAFGLVESVVLIGAPIPSEEGFWRRLRTVVAGRVVNVYSQEDHILGFLYRTSSLQYGVAGLQSVEGVDRIENYDATKLMNSKGHAMYKYIIGRILREIGLEDIDLLEVEREEVVMRKDGDGPVMGNLIPTEDLLSSPESSRRNDFHVREGEKHDVSVGKIREGLAIGGDVALEELFISPPPPNKVKETDRLKEVAMDPPTIQGGSTKWPSKIETDSQVGNGPSTPNTDEEDNDDEASQEIVMVDLDPEPIL